MTVDAGAIIGGFLTTLHAHPRYLAWRAGPLGIGRVINLGVPTEIADELDQPALTTIGEAPFSARSATSFCTAGAARSYVAFAKLLDTWMPGLRRYDGRSLRRLP